MHPSVRRLAAFLRFAVLAVCAAATLAVGASCTRTKQLGGLMLLFEADGSLAPDTLHVTVTTAAGTPLLDWCYPIDTPATFFPTTLAVVSDGDPAATVRVTAAVLRGNVTLDVFENEVAEVPASRVAELPILFTARCSVQLSTSLGAVHGNDCAAGVALSLCPAGQTCDPYSGVCVSDQVNGSTLPDAGAPDALPPGPPDAALAEVAEESTTAPSVDSTVDAPPPPRSAGCGTAPAANSTAFTHETIAVPACGDSGLAYPACVVDAFAPGGAAYQSAVGSDGRLYDYLNRDYAIELPDNYDPGTPYPVYFSAGECGSTPPQTHDAFPIGETGAIRVSLSYVRDCFADGGQPCWKTPDNAKLCETNPEVPYFATVLEEIEANYCVDTSRVFVGGSESGAFEADTLGCALAGRVRGIVTSAGGGAHLNRPPCSGPVAAIMVEGLSDTEMPVGPLLPNQPDLQSGLSAAQVNQRIDRWDSYGMASARDDVLLRNACTSRATAAYDPAFPACVKYVMCPAAYPVVYCPLPGVGNSSSTYMGVDYTTGVAAGERLMWHFLSTLPPTR